MTQNQGYIGTSQTDVDQANHAGPRFTNSDTTALVNDTLLVVTTTAAVRITLLPSTQLIEGRSLVIRRPDSMTPTAPVTVAAAAGIEGKPTQTFTTGGIVLTPNGEDGYFATTLAPGAGPNVTAAQLAAATSP